MLLTRYADLREVLKVMDSSVRDLSYQVVDAFSDDGCCVRVRQFAVPIPLIAIGEQIPLRGRSPRRRARNCLSSSRQKRPAH
jgi:hypothetical protein